MWAHCGSRVALEPMGSFLSSPQNLAQSLLLKHLPTEGCLGLSVNSKDALFSSQFGLAGFFVVMPSHPFFQRPKNWVMALFKIHLQVGAARRLSCTLLLEEYKNLFP